MRQVVAGLVALVAALALAKPAGASDRTLDRYAEGTWRSFEAMTDARSGLPADVLERDGTRSAQTSTTNVGAYMWSAVVAERLGIIRRSELVARMRRTIGTLEGLERHQESGQFYNWYDHRTGEKLETWPPTGEPITPILSTVDNGWLAVGLKVVSSRVPELSRRARELYESMDFGFYYRPAVNRMLFHFVPDTGEAVLLRHDRQRQPDRRLPRDRQAGAARARVLRRLAVVRGTCDWSWAETRPEGFTRTHFGISVYDGSLPYNGTLVTPSWGGSMFEALMPSLFVPEECWAPGSWGANHPLTVAAQIHHGLREPATATGGSRPPTSRRAAIGSTASTGSAATRAATRRAATAR